MSMKTGTVILLMMIVLLSGCYKEPWYGADGRSGNAYLSLTWVDAEPYYIDVGTSAIPYYFEWDRYYRAYPGVFTLYYDGEVWTGYRWATYAWEIDYEIYRIPGESGGKFYNGRDGADIYFTLECSPYGPYVYEDYKNQPMKEGWEILAEGDDEIILLKEKDGFGIKVTYKKTSVRKEQNLQSDKVS